MALNYLVTIRNDMTTTGIRLSPSRRTSTRRRSSLSPGRLSPLVLPLSTTTSASASARTVAAQFSRTTRRCVASTQRPLPTYRGAKAPARSSNCSRTQQAPLRLDLR